MKNEHEFKVGDLVERYQNGFNAGKKIGDTFIISKVNDKFVYDDNGEGHNYKSVRLVTAKLEINNNYSIY